LDRILREVEEIGLAAKKHYQSDQYLEYIYRQFEKGKYKYGKSLYAAELKDKEIINHLLEEITDCLFYIIKLELNSGISLDSHKDSLTKLFGDVVKINAES